MIARLSEVSKKRYIKKDNTKNIRSGLKRSNSKAFSFYSVYLFDSGIVFLFGPDLIQKRRLKNQLKKNNLKKNQNKFAKTKHCYVICSTTIQTNKKNKIMNTLELNLLNINKDFYTGLINTYNKRIQKLEKSIFDRTKSINKYKSLVERYESQLLFIESKLK